MPDTTSDQRERAVFRAARAIEDAAQRDVYLEAACGADRDLRSRVDSLLVAADEAGAFLESPPIASDFSTYVRAVAETPGEMIGPYKLLEQIGEGGFGVVYMADQVAPIQRRVALKIIKIGMDTKQVIARFEAERQALALMDHPNIAKVLDAGTTEAGRPYFVMELVRGISVTEYCDDRGLSTDERLGIFMEICSAVQHAHQKGIIHRDIKPSNILVSTNGDRPVPKVIDFGIAKATQGRLTDKTLFTQFRQFIGTPAYMSPEQAQMSAVDVDTRSDIYSLGVLLYELLTGKTPLDGKELQKAGYEELCRRIREDEAPKPSTRLSSLTHAEISTLAKHRRADPASLSGEVRGDLDWIVMKSVEKDRSRRYATAEALAEDIGRHLSQQPVSAAPPSATYRLRRLARRNRGILLTTGAIAAALVIGTTISIWQAIRATHHSSAAESEAERARDAEYLANEQSNQLRTAEKQARDAQAAAEARADELERRAYLVHLANADAALLGKNYSFAQSELDACPEAQRGWEWHFLVKRLRATISPPFPGAEYPVFTHDGRRLMAIGPMGTDDQRKVQFWDLSSNVALDSLEHDTPLSFLAQSPDERRIVAADVSGNLLLWDAETRDQLWMKKIDEDGTEGLAFNHDGSLIACASWDGMQVVDSETGKERFTKEGAFRNVMFSPIGGWIAAGSHRGNGSAMLIDLDTWEVAEEFPDGHMVPTFAPSGKLLATANRDGQITLWDWDGENLTPGRSWQASIGSGELRHIRALEFTDDGALLVSGGRDRLVKVWDVATGGELASLDAGDIVYWLAIDPQDEQIALFTLTEGIRLWRFGEPHVGPSVKPLDAAAFARFSSDGRQIAASYASRHLAGLLTGVEYGRGPVVAIHGTSGRTIRSLGNDLYVATWTPDGKAIVAASGDSDYFIEVRDALTDEVILKSRTEQRFRPWAVGISPVGNRIVSVDGGGGVSTWDFRADKFRPLTEPPGGFVSGVGISHDAALVAMKLENYTVEILDVVNERSVASIPVPQQQVRQIVFPASGTRIYVGSNAGVLTAYDIESGQEVQNFRGHIGHVAAVAVSPDETQIVSGDESGRTIVWDVASGESLITLSDNDEPITSVDWSSDGARIAVGKDDGTVQIWELSEEP